MDTFIVRDYKNYLNFWQRLRNGIVKNEEKVLKNILEDNRCDMRYRVVAAAHLLPADIFRRWLRWSNTDFQGFELFLKRITSDQIVTLLAHANMYLLGNDRNIMPCYKQGMRNKFWKCVEFFVKTPVENKKSKYEESKAIAHDFFGFGFGFTTYANEEHSEPVNKSVMRDLLRNDKEKGFEVNQEELGIYFIFYHLMRKNALWGKEKVKLSPYICPGFWITLFGWFFFLILSPLFAVASVFSYGWQAWLFSVLGAVTPCILIAWGWLHMFKNTSYDEEFWKKIIEVIGASFLAAGLVGLIVLIIGINSLTLFLFTVWGIITYAHEKKSLFRLPVLSKLFSALTPVMIYLDATRHEKFLEVLVAIYKNALFPILGLVIGVFIFIAMQLVVDSKKEESLEKRYELFKKMKVFMYFLAVIFVSLLWFVPVKGFDLPLNLDLTIALFSFVLFLGIIFYSGNCDPYKKQVEEYIADMNSGATKRKLNRLFSSSLAKNQNIFSDSRSLMGVFSYETHDLLRRFMDYDYEYVKELQHFLLNAKNVEVINSLAEAYDTTVGRILWHSGPEFQMMYAEGIDIELMAEVWQANGYGTYIKTEYGNIILDRVIKPVKIDKAEEVKVSKENIFLAKLEYLLEKALRFFVIIFSMIGGAIIYVPVTIWKLWKLFNERCPKIEEKKVFG